MTEPETAHARLMGINHLVLEVGSLEEALEFYEAIFDIDLRGQTDSKAFLDMGDQFLVLAETDVTGDTADNHRHFGLVVDDPTAVEARLDELAVEQRAPQSLDFHDPWGNRIQIVAYEEIQFTKADHILDAMNLSKLEKSESAIAELAEKNMAPE